MAFGDINGDGREDIMVGMGWYERPEGDPMGQHWIWHPHGGDNWHASVPSLVRDMNEDGINDVIWGKGHAYGLYWWEGQGVDAKGEPGYIAKRFSPAAKNIIIEHSWAGNVRELLNTIKRVTFIADGKRITKDDMFKAIQPALNRHVSTDRVLNRDLSEGIDLEKLTDDVKKHYLQRAMKHTRGNKLDAAKILGIRNYQTLTNWLGKYKIKF